MVLFRFVCLQEELTSVKKERDALQEDLNAANASLKVWCGYTREREETAIAAVLFTFSCDSKQLCVHSSK